MTRLWTEEETGALREYIDSRLGHCGGLNGPYWDELSLALESVRKANDPVLRKPQVTNKIVQFRKREVSCGHVLQYGTHDDKIKKLNAYKRHHKSAADLAEPAPAADKPLQSFEAVTEQPIALPNDTQNTAHIEKILTASSEVLASCEPEHKFECRSDLHTPLQAIAVASSDPKSNSCAGLKRTQSDDSCPTSTNSRGRKRRMRRKYAAHERSVHKGSVPEKQAARTSTHDRDTNKAGQFSRRTSEHIQEDVTKVCEPSKRLLELETLGFADVGNVAWQDQIFQAWQGYLTYQDSIHIIPQEPIDHREVLYTIEDISNCIGEASEAVQKMFWNSLNISRLSASGAQILSTLAGFKTQSEATDALMVGRSLAPLSTEANFLRTFLGATVHQWIFEGFRSVGPDIYRHDLSGTVFDNFIRRECPKLWTSYQNLYHHQFLSTYNEERIINESTKMAGDIYLLLSAGYSATSDMHVSPYADRLTFSTAFPIQAQYYQTFKRNMIEAYRLALDLRVCLAKCNDLTYEFHFPKMRDTFDVSCMEAWKSGIVDDATLSEGQCIAACFLPSIWSKAKNENDHGRPSTLVTKAIVLL